MNDEFNDLYKNSFKFTTEKEQDNYRKVYKLSMNAKEPGPLLLCGTPISDDKLDLETCFRLISKCDEHVEENK